MTVRIFKIDDTLRIDGRLDASNMEALLGVSEDLSGPVKLDLTNLLSADENYFKLLIDTKRDKQKNSRKSTKG